MINNPITLPLDNVIEKAKNILELEASTIQATSEALNSHFLEAIQILLQTEGRVIVTGVGKSGLIGHKIASTLRSTGTKAYFINSSEAAHGDLGSIDAQDTVIALSNSGKTVEILTIVPMIKKIGAKLIAITSNVSSPLAEQANVTIPIVVEREACVLNLAPTCSTTAMLAIGDCIAIILSEIKQFKEQDFALYHPGGNLGKKLYLSVKDILKQPYFYPVALKTTSLTDVVLLLTKAPYGGINIVDDEENRHLLGIITEGDIRRALVMGEKFFSLRAEDIMSSNSITVTPETSLAEALELMENRKSQISVLSVVNAEGRALGILRIHDIFQP